jgi:hypothetical protein
LEDSNYKNIELFFRLDCYIHILSLAYKIHSSIYRLRQYKRDPIHKNETFHDYVIQIKISLDELLRDSYEDEKRKLEVIFGLVEVVAELLIADIDVFDLNPDSSKYEEAKTIRKLIANLLTNLVFGNAKSKRKLCNYSGFIPEVTRIIEKSPGLSVFYAALIRNLSWQADNSMKISLSRIVPALSSAAIKAHSNGDSKCLLATLSALWNLGSHSMENKKAMCETHNFLSLIISLLDCAPAHTTMVENASGILKYACAYIITKRDLLQQLHHAKLIRQLLNLLNSSSFTIVINALNSLCQLAQHDSQTQQKLMKAQPRALLEKLRNSVHDEVRNTVKELLNHLNQSTAVGYYSMPRNPQQQTMMYYSTTSESAYSSGGSTLLPIRGGFPQYPPVVHQVNPFVPFSPQHYQHHPQPQQQNTLPKSMRIFKPEQRGPPSVHLQQENSNFLRDIQLEAGMDIPESLLATRSGSVQSLTDEIGTDSSWRSTENTDAPNSADLSPVSESEIPDSPTEFAVKQVAISARKYGSRKESSNRGSFNNEDDEEEDIYGIKMHANDKSRDELSQAIVNALPPPKQSTPHLSLQSTPRLPKPIHAIPQQLFTEEFSLPNDDEEIDFDDSINDEPVPPPSSIPSSTTSTATSATMPISKNEMSSTVTNMKDFMEIPQKPLQPSHHHPLQVKMMMMNDENPKIPPSRDNVIDVMKSSSLLQSPSTREKLRDASSFFKHNNVNGHEDADEDDGELSEDSFCCSSEDIVALEDLTAVPDDVDQAFQAEKVIIDCGSLSKGLRQSSKLPRSSAASITSADKSTNVKIGLLSAATIKRLSKSRNPLPMIQSKTSSNKSKSARVSPFNYKEPTSLPPPPSTDKSQNSSKSHNLLVTTV